MQNYLVIGIYSDDYQRFAEAYEAETSDEAEQIALDLHPGLIIAGVLNDGGRVVA